MAYGINTEVDNRANAFKSNPQALEQRYAKDQQLLDLLALQKLKSDMDMAKREMMLKSAKAGQSPTVKAQREKEVFDMTKEDVAKRVTDVAQQRQQEEQQRMQELMQSGIAQAPAPNMATLAGGGIVAFAGEDGSYVEGKEEKIPSPPPRINPVTRKINPAYVAWAQKYFSVSAEELADKEEEIKARFIENQRKYRTEARRDIPTPYEEFTKIRNQTPTGDRPGPARPIEGFDISKEEFGFGRPGPRPDPTLVLSPAPAIRAAAPGAAGVTQERPPMPDETEAETARLRRQAAPVPPVPPPAPPTAPRPAPRPAAAAPAPGLPALPAAPAPTAGEQGIASLQGPLAEKVRRDIALDPQARQRSEEERIRKMYEATLGTPEEQRQQRLKQFLLGAANRGSLGSTMAGGLAGSLREQNRQREELQGAIGQGIAGGLKSYEQTSMDARQGLQSGTQLVDSTLDRAFKEKELLSNRQIAELDARVKQSQIAATRALQEAQLDANNQAKQDAALRAINYNIATLTEKIAARYAEQIKNAEMALRAAGSDEKKKAEAQAKIDSLRKQAEAEANKQTLDMREQADSIRRRQIGDAGQFKIISKQS